MSIRSPNAWLRALSVTALILSLSSNVHGSDAIQSWQLHDDVEVMLLEDHRAPLVYITVYFGVNTMMPWSVENGAEAAFISQIWDADRTIVRSIEESGVSLATSIGWSRARIYGSSLASDFPRLIELMRQTIHNKELNKEEVRKWQRDRTVAWKANTLHPRSVLSRAAISLLYPSDKDPRNSLFDQPKSVRMDVKRFRDVRDAILASAPCTIAVAGAISKRELHELIHDLLPPRDSGLEFVETTHQPATFKAGESKVIEHENLTQVYMALIRDSLPRGHQDFPAYSVVNQILGGTFGSRLYEKLRHETGDTYSATLGSWYTTTTRPGMLILQTYTNTANAPSAEARFKEVLVELVEHGVTQTEVDDALAYLRGSLMFSKETPSQIVSLAASNKVVGLPVNFRELSIDRASRMSLVKINEFVRDFYDPSKFALVKVVPKL